jgi:uncharacterized RDD family membrane protein YckC
MNTPPESLVRSHATPAVTFAPTPAKAPALWRRVLAGILDFFTAFLGFGVLVAALTGNLTSTGFKLEGVPALIAIVLMIAYFVVGRRVGGPIWRRVLRAR